ncbi:MAG: fibronectin type III domain-containing protein [Acidobacteria bacterium]|nr:fibronectin type III domain-containing protein [Acidobacteriota bacterium]
MIIEKPLLKSYRQLQHFTLRFLPFQKLVRLLPFAFCLFTFALCLLFSACGKVSAPIPPARLTERTSELSALQRGSKILLSWPAPALTKDDKSSSYVARVDIYRLVELRHQEPVLDVEDYENEAQIIGFLDRATIETQLTSLGHLEFSDAVNLQQAPAGARLRYAVRYVNKRGQQAAFSNTVTLEPVARIALEPANLHLAGQQQDEVFLEWEAPKTNVDGTTPAAVVGYNLYRVRANRKSAREALNDEPLTATHFVDRTFQYKNEYAYFVRSLSQGSNGLIESADSQPLTLTPLDTFAPVAPNPVSIASANGVISLFWPGSTEKDVVRYQVYRATTADAEAKDWQKIATLEAKFVTFRDDKVTLDNRYFYRVTAVDRFANESPPSLVVSETAHP